MVNINLDILELEYDSSGITNFYHPAGMVNDQVKIFYELLRQSIVKIKKTFPISSADYDQFTICFFPLFLYLYNVFSVGKYYHELHVSPNEIIVPDRYNGFKAIKNRKLIKLPNTMVRRKKEGIIKKSVKFLPKIARNTYLNQFNQVKRSCFPKITKVDAISLLHDDLVNTFVKRRAYKTIYVDRSYWFGSLPSYIMNLQGTLGAAASQVYDSLFTNFIDAFSYKKISGLREHYVNQCLECISYTMNVFNFIHAHRANDIPNLLLVGSSKPLDVRILMRLVRKHGGDVVKFDHGAGRAFAKGSLFQYHFDYDDIDLFVTYNKNSADEYKKKFDGSLCLQNNYLNSSS